MTQDNEAATSEALTVDDLLMLPGSKPYTLCVVAFIEDDDTPYLTWTVHVTHFAPESIVDEVLDEVRDALVEQGVGYSFICCPHIFPGHVNEYNQELSN